MGLKFNRLKNFYISGTTSANTSEAMRKKKENPWHRSDVFPMGFCSKGIFIKAVNRKGVQFVNDETVPVDNDSTEMTVSNIKAVRVGATLLVEAFRDGNGYLWVRAGSFGIAGSTVTWGTMVKVVTGLASSFDVVPLKEGTFALSFRGDNTWAQLVLGSISGTAITLGTVFNITEASIMDSGTAVGQPTEGFVVVCYQSGADSKGYAVGVDFSGVTAGTLGTPVEFGTVAVNPRVCKYADSYLMVAYQDTDGSSRPLLTNTLTFSSEDTSIVAGTPEDISGAEGANTCVDIHSLGDDSVVVSWIDNSDAHMRAATISGTVVTWGSELAFATDNTAYLSVDMLDSTGLIAAWENTSKSNYLYTTTITKSGSTLTASGYLDPAVEAESTKIDVVALNGSDILLLFTDEANSDYLTEQYGQVKPNLVDVRSTTASIAFNGYLVSKGKDGLGTFGAVKLTGTTHGTANTTMATNPTLPWNKARDILVLTKDQGVYVYDDGTVAPKKSGVSASGRTIDVRSNSTSVAFEVYALRVINYVRTVAL